MLLIDLADHSVRLLDRSRYARIHGIAWSPDGQWLAYSFQETSQASIIKLCRVETGETWPATKPLLEDLAPSFDPGGKYLYFISYREFNPVRDSLHFNLGFPRGGRPFLVTLQADTMSPFGPPSGETKDDDTKADEPKNGETKDDEPKGDEPKSGKEDRRSSRCEIDLEGITERLVAFPVPEGRYAQVRGIKGKVLFSSFPIEGTLGAQAPGDNGPRARSRSTTWPSAASRR